MNLHLRHRPAPEGVGEFANDAEEHQQPNSRRRKIVAAVSAAALVGGITGVALSSGGESSKPKAAKNTATAPSPTTPNSEATITTSPPTSQLKAGAESLCPVVPESFISSTLGSSLPCRTTDANQNGIFFNTLDVSHAVWGGPEGDAPAVGLSYGPISANGVQNRFNSASQINSANTPVVVDGYKAAFGDAQVQNDNGEFDVEELFVDAGKYLVILTIENVNANETLSQQQMVDFGTKLMQISLPS